MCMCSVCVCVYVYIYVCIYIYIYTYFMCTYIYVLNISIFCTIWLRKCDFLTEKLGIKFIPDPDWPDPDPKWFIPDPTPDPDPDPAKSSGSTTLVTYTLQQASQLHLSSADTHSKPYIIIWAALSAGKPYLYSLYVQKIGPSIIRAKSK